MLTKAVLGGFYPVEAAVLRHTAISDQTFRGSRDAPIVVELAGEPKPPMFTKLNKKSKSGTLTGQVPYILEADSGSSYPCSKTSSCARATAGRAPAERRTAQI